jgi:hypothetical protein
MLLELQQLVLLVLEQPVNYQDDVFIVKVDINNIKLARSAEEALKSVPKVLDITSAGIGTNHKFTSVNSNAKILCCT